MTVTEETHSVPRTRTHTCGELRPSDVGADVVLMGWVHKIRDLGGLTFLDMRDRHGLTQVVARDGSEVLARIKQVRPEYVIAVAGPVERRSEETLNPKIATGEVEVEARTLVVLSEARTAAVPDRRGDPRLGGGPPALSLPRPAPRADAREHRAAPPHHDGGPQQPRRRRVLGDRDAAAHQVDAGRGPRLPGAEPAARREFYALPQSPQIFKQILMVSGMDRYFQIVKCFRDEDLRADRQPEFTQIDVEMSFVDQEAVFSAVEHLMQAVFRVVDKEVPAPFPRMTYDEAMTQYGATSRTCVSRWRFRTSRRCSARAASRSSASSWRGADRCGRWWCRAPAGSRARRSTTSSTRRWRWREGDGLGAAVAGRGDTELHPEGGGRGGPDAGRRDGRGGAGRPDADRRGTGYEASVLLGQFRLRLGQREGLIDEDRTSLSWVVDFPLMEWSETEQRLVSMHHPFTSPRPEDLDRLEDDPAAVRARAYDLVLNGNEIGGGSIRIHEAELQARIFRLLKISDEEAKARFGFFLDALQYGTPPHGGIALGLDRIVALVAGEPSIRDVMAFPKTAAAVDLMAGSPSTVDRRQLRELHLE